MNQAKVLVLTPYDDDDDDLRTALHTLADSDAVQLMDGWWSSSQSLMLQTIAAWLKMPFLGEDGEPLPTSSQRG